MTNGKFSWRTLNASEWSWSSGQEPLCVELSFKGDRNVVVTSGLLLFFSTFPIQLERKRSPTCRWKLPRLVNSAGHERKRFPATDLHVSHHLTATVYNAWPQNKLSINSVFIQWQNVYICGHDNSFIFKSFYVSVIVVWYFFRIWYYGNSEYMESNIFCTTRDWGCSLRSWIKILNVHIQQRSDRGATLSRDQEQWRLY